MRPCSFPSPKPAEKTIDALSRSLSLESNNDERTQVALED
jgi:hypothetical protein